MLIGTSVKDLLPYGGFSYFYKEIHVMKTIATLLAGILFIILLWFHDSIWYHREIQTAYDFFSKADQKRIKHERYANVHKRTGIAGDEVMNHLYETISLDGRRTLRIVFPVKDYYYDPLVVHLDLDTKKVIGAEVSK